MTTIPLYAWVNDNNPPAGIAYSKGWWDGIEFAYHLAETYPEAVLDVIATAAIDTPPPTEQLVMPIVRFQQNGLEIGLLFDFSSIGPCWTVSVRRPTGADVWLYDLIAVDEPVPEHAFAPFPAAWHSGAYAEDASTFSCQLTDEYGVYAFVWVLSHPAQQTG